MIRVRGLRKQYGRVAALDGLDLDVPPGAIFGFIGQNGAGKTTTIRILATLLAPDAGAAEVGGVDLRRQAGRARRLVGYVPDFFGVYDDLKVAEYLDFYADLHGVRGGAGARLRDDLLELVELGPRREDYVEHLSRGMQQRLCLARALIHDPPVLLLDEPASGLDPVGRVELREILRELGRMGKTILISSHILSELADLCSHVGMVAAGRMVRQGTVAEVVWAAERPAYRLRVLREPERAAALLTRVAGVGGVSTDEDAIRFRADDAEAAAAALAAVVSAEIPVIRFAELEQTLESTFVRLARTGAGGEMLGWREGGMAGAQEGEMAGGRAEGSSP
jgi:ABC-2 type transport system ATP-binding protein